MCRAQRQKIKLLEEGEADEQAIINARARYVKTSDEYVIFSKSMGLSQQGDRVTVGGNSLEGITKPKKANSPIGGIKTSSLPVKNTENHTFKGKFGVEKSVKSDIIKIEKQCFIHQDKINKFFLKPGAKHAQEFFDVGYSTEDYELLNADLVGGFDYSKAIDKQIDKNGVEKFSIFMNLGTKQKKLFRTVWQKDTPDSVPRIITAHRENKIDV